MGMLLARLLEVAPLGLFVGLLVSTSLSWGNAAFPCVRQRELANFSVDLSTHKCLIILN